LTHPSDVGAPYEPRWPALTATGLLSFWVLILSLPLWTGKFLGGGYSDQFHSGFAFREWLAHTWKRLGEIPLWNPEMFGGLPFVGAMHGDVFYPTAWLRLVLPTGFAMGLGFVIHYILAGLFVYWLLRLLRVSWAGAITGGFAYQLSGVVGSYVQPGHDGKLFVTALLPLALVGLVLGMRDRKWSGYGLLALSVGLALLSPHAQMTYYMLITAGLFALYLAFGEAGDRPIAEKLGALGLAFGAVVVGFGVGMIQLLPFYEYLPYSPRAEGYYGFEGSTSYAIPWSHLLEFFFAGFTGTTPAGTYWGPNPLKLHSEYLGLVAIALAVLGAFDKDRRRTVLWLGSIGLLFLLICAGSATPFYRLWWTVMPFVKQTRAPGMALFVVALVIALLAGFGTDRLQRGEGQKWYFPWTIAGAVALFLAIVGAFGGVAQFLARGVEMELARPVTDVANRAQGDIRVGAMASAAALVLLGTLGWASARGKLKPLLLAVALPLLVSADLWRNARDFWTYSEAPQDGVYGYDVLTDELTSQPLPYRVMNLSDTGIDVYPGASLMAFDVPQILGHHGNQLHDFNELLGGKNVWQYLYMSRRLWDLYAVRYVLLPTGIELAGQLPAYFGLEDDFDPLMTGVQASSGVRADVFVRREPVPYARLVPAALKIADEEAIPSVADPRSPLSFDQLVLLDPEASVDPEPVENLPEPLDARVVVESWDVGTMVLRIEPPAPSASYVVVAENYYPDWNAQVDGQDVPVLRGNVSLITVPVPVGAEQVSLEFRSGAYTKGRLITWLSLVIIGGVIVVPVVTGRRRG